MKYFFTKQNKGFTLVEMIVSLGIFALVMVVAMGAFLKISDVNKRAQNVKNAVNNVNFTLEAMSRELRTGTNYVVTTSSGVLSAVGEQVTFIANYTPAGAPVYYAYRRAVVGGRGVIQKGSSNTPIVSVFTDVTAPSVDIKTFQYILSPKDYSILKIFIVGEAGSVEKLKTTFSVQTSVSQRLKDN